MVDVRRMRSGEIEAETSGVTMIGLRRDVGDHGRDLAIGTGSDDTGTDIGQDQETGSMRGAESGETVIDTGTVEAMMSVLEVGREEANATEAGRDRHTTTGDADETSDDE